MNCATLEARLSDYLDRLLSPGEQHSLEAHLASCDGCRRLHESMEEVLAWGRNFPVFEAPEWLVTRILANTPRKERETWEGYAGGTRKLGPGHQNSDGRLHLDDRVRLDFQHRRNRSQPWPTCEARQRSIGVPVISSTMRTTGLFGFITALRWSRRFSPRSSG